jgi:hypothetical protein
MNVGQKRVHKFSRKRYNKQEENIRLVLRVRES